MIDVAAEEECCPYCGSRKLEKQTGFGGYEHTTCQECWVTQTARRKGEDDEIPRTP